MKQTTTIGVSSSTSQLLNIRQHTGVVYFVTKLPSADPTADHLLSNFNRTSYVKSVFKLLINEWLVNASTK